MSSATPSAADQAVGRIRGLIAATCAIAASAERGPDGPVEALVEQAALLLAVDARVLPAAPATGRVVERRRGRACRSARAPEPDRGSRDVNALVRAAIERGRPVPSGGQPAALAAPIVAAGELFGVLYARWPGQTVPSPVDVEVVDALVRQAALAIRAARQSAAAAAARARSEAIFGALSDAVLVFGRDGRLIEANRAGREWIGLAAGRAASSAAALGLSAGPCRADRVAPPARPVDRALAGQSAADELPWTSPDRGERRLHVVATPILDSQGRVRAAAVIARDVTDFYRAVSGRARFDGAVKTARRITHELGNQLSPVLGYAEILVGALEGEESEFAVRVMNATLEAADTLGRLQRIIRFEQTEFGGEEMLDLDAATVDQRDRT